ncbi:MAG TPA: response regulator, partial [Burkholderiaceae bacterium]
IRASAPPGGDALVIVALTADALPSDRQRCLDAGMNDFLTKPVSSSQLSATIERWTGRPTAPATQW